MDVRFLPFSDMSNGFFLLLSRNDDYVSADDMHLLRNLACACLGLLKGLKQEQPLPQSDAVFSAPRAARIFLLDCYHNDCDSLETAGSLDRRWRSAQNTIVAALNFKASLGMSSNIFQLVCKHMYTATYAIQVNKLPTTCNIV